MNKNKNIGPLISGILILLFFIAVSYLIYIENEKASGTDINVEVNLNENGLVDKYNLYIYFPDTETYNTYQREVTSDNIHSIEDYFYRNISSKGLFSYNYDSDNNIIEFKNTKSFDPNIETKTISIDKANWIFTDTSYESGIEYFIPDKKINKLDYLFTINADQVSINDNSIQDLSNGLFYYLFQENTVNLNIDRKKGLIYKGTGEQIPAISVKTSIPKKYSYLPIILLIVGSCGVIFAVLYVASNGSFLFRRDW